jgi:hypothetical protein
MAAYFSSALGGGITAGRYAAFKTQQADLKTEQARSNAAYEKELAYYDPDTQAKIRVALPWQPGWEQKWAGLVEGMPNAGTQQQLDLKTAQMPLDAAMQRAKLGEAAQFESNLETPSGVDLTSPTYFQDIRKPREVPGQIATMAMPGVTSQGNLPSVYARNGRLGTPVQQEPQPIEGSGFAAPVQLPSTMQTPSLRTLNQSKLGLDQVKEERYQDQAEQKAVADGLKLGIAVSKGELNPAFAQVMFEANNPGIPWNESYLQLGRLGEATIAGKKATTAFTVKKTSLLDKQFEVVKMKANADVARINAGIDHNKVMADIARDRVTAYEQSVNQQGGPAGRKPMTGSTYENIRAKITDLISNPPDFADAKKQSTYHNLKRWELAELDDRMWIGAQGQALAQSIRAAKGKGWAQSKTAKAVQANLESYPNLPAESIQLLKIKYMKRYYEGKKWR